MTTCLKEHHVVNLQSDWKYTKLDGNMAFGFVPRQTTPGKSEHFSMHVFTRARAQKRKSWMECSLCLFVHYKQDSLFSLSWLWTLIYRAVCSGIAANSLVYRNHLFPSFLYRAPSRLTHPVEASHTIHFHLVAPHFYSARMLCLPVFSAKCTEQAFIQAGVVFETHVQSFSPLGPLWMSSTMLKNMIKPHSHC